MTSFHFENSNHAIHGVYCMIIIIGALYAFITMQVGSEKYDHYFLYKITAHVVYNKVHICVIH